MNDCKKCVELESALDVAQETISKQDDRIEELEAENAELKEQIAGYTDKGFWGRTASRQKSRISELEGALKKIEGYDAEDNDPMYRNAVRQFAKQALKGDKEE